MGDAMTTHAPNLRSEFDSMIAGNYFYGKCWSKLNEGERGIILDFLGRNWGKPHAEREMMISRLFLDKRDDKPKRWTTILDLLCCFNSYWNRTQESSAS